MDLDPSNFTRTEEEKRQTAEQQCAHAVALEVRADGVEWISIEATREGPGRYKPNPADMRQTSNFDLAVCRLAGLAWAVVYHDDEEMRLQARRTIDGSSEGVMQPDFFHARARAADSQELETAWEEAKAFCRDRSELIKHAASRLIDNFNELDEPTLQGNEIRRYVENPEAYGL